MCLILFAYKIHHDHSLILGANRDEFYERPTAPLDWWKDYPSVLAGRDLRGGGTWMGITRTGKFAGITNFRDPASLKKNAPSRGALVSDFLCGDEPPLNYLERVHPSSEKYNGFNLILGDGTGLFYYSNYQNKIHRLTPGIYGLSNRFIDSPWPKVETGKAHLKKLIQQGTVDDESIFKLLENRDQPPDDQLPNTGVGMEWERILSPLFICGDTYGTRSSSVIRMEREGIIHFSELSFKNHEDEKRCHTLPLKHFSVREESGGHEYP